MLKEGFQDLKPEHLLVSGISEPFILAMSSLTSIASVSDILFFQDRFGLTFSTIEKGGSP